MVHHGSERPECKGVKKGQTEKRLGIGAHRDKIVKLLLQSDDNEGRQKTAEDALPSGPHSGLRRQLNKM